MSRLREKYDAEIKSAMTEKFGYKNVMQIPKLDKIVINMGVGEARENAKVLDAAIKFLDRLVNLALPRVRDFRGVNPNGFDGRGNYALGIKEQLIFPEIEYDKIDKVRGMDIIFVTTAETDEEGRELLTLFGMPYSK